MDTQLRPLDGRLARAARSLDNLILAGGRLASFGALGWIIAGLVASQIPDPNALAFWKIVEGRLNWSLFVFVLGIFGQIEFIRRLVVRASEASERQADRVHTLYNSVVRELADASSEKAVVLRDSVGSSVWRGFVGVYRAYNPTFGMDIRFSNSVRYHSERVKLHAQRYAEGGVVTSRYYLHVGELNDSETEKLIIRNFLIFVRLIEREYADPSKRRSFDREPSSGWKFPYLNDRIVVHTISGPRSPMSCFLGHKNLFDGGLENQNEPNFSITYFTQLPPSLTSDNEQTPRMLTVRRGEAAINELKSLFKGETEESLEEFCNRAVLRLKIVIPPASSWVAISS